ncbi:MAG: DUF2336 domain-containing protein [Rhizomicrobium sp.]
MSEEKPSLSAEKALHLLEKHERDAPGTLSSRTDAGDDVLRYLAQNGAVATRSAVAANPTTPADANLSLANDAAETVRSVLAAKIGKLFPGMFIAEEEHLRNLAIQTLERLAADEAVRVRKVLAEEIKLLDCIPKQVITRLAQDAHSEVSSPVAEFSPLLTDDDLIELVAAAETNAVMNAVARRKGLTDRVSDAVIATQDTGVVTTLLKNVDASIRKQTLDKLVTQAAEVAEWHGPLVMRTELSPRAVKRLSAFVTTALVRTLVARNNIDEKTQALLTKRLQERRRLAQDLRPGVELNSEESDALADVEMAARSGLLNDSFVARAIEERHRETVICALARLNNINDKVVRTLLEANSAKAITALVWKAGLNMRTAYNIQTTVMRLPADQLMSARDGTEFPMTEEEMRWHLSYVGLEKQ